MSVVTFVLCLLSVVPGLVYGFSTAGNTIYSHQIRRRITCQPLPRIHHVLYADLSMKHQIVPSLHSFTSAGPNLIPAVGNDCQDRDYSKLETEFYSMMKEFASYTPKDIASVPDPRYRCLYEGVKEGSNEPLVMKAFAIVFEDLLPVRVAGRMIYRHLKTTMEASQKNANMEENDLRNEYGLDQNMIDQGRIAFTAIMKQDQQYWHESCRQGQITIDTFVDTGIVDILMNLLHVDSFEDFIEAMDIDETETISFKQFMIGMHSFSVRADESCGGCCTASTLSKVFTDIYRRIQSLSGESGKLAANSKHGEKYEEMVNTFQDWEETIVPSSFANTTTTHERNKSGRMMEVLIGSFAGAKNEKIVLALKIVYIDYSALRLGGDLVFKLMKKIVERRKKKLRS
ncbi:hypothetical protein CTEN210_01764 [Chaetoceros tenuissimus]|uniref:Calmodulin n=1 Tax=Chaetoceros tenuissimus TaxID=426638 RepID=A0AAD3GZZ1_9STRA|nr:hypothetical protein CTEN210_01764 [Chaetoceros tenuissimus]